MKQLFCLIFSTLLIFVLFSGCGKSSLPQVSASAYRLNSSNRNDPNDAVLQEQLLPSDALFAYSTSRTDTEATITVYVWHTPLLGRLHHDFTRLAKGIPMEDKTISVSIAEKIFVNKKDINYLYRHDESYAVIRSLFPTQFRVNAKDFYFDLSDLCFFTSTNLSLDDHKVIALQVTTQGDLPLPDSEEIRFINSLDEIPQFVRTKE